MRRALALLCLAPAALASQERVWIDQLYPFAYYSTVDGFWLGGHYGWSSPMTASTRPEPHFANLRFDAAASTQGSSAVVADAQAPAHWDGWRVGLTFSAARANRLGYYGQGNDTPFESDSVTPANPFLYRVSRTTRGARLTVQRRLVGPLRVLAGGSLERTDFRELPGDSRFRRDRIAGIVRPEDVPFNDQVIRGGLVVDWRDQEVDPHRGVLAEVLVGEGSGYTRTTAALHAYVHPFDRLMLAARLAGERMTGEPPVAAQLTMESSRGPAVALGGYSSLRGYHDGRFVGPGKLLGGVEARYAVVWAPRVLEIKIVAFYDFGRVFGPGEKVRLTRSGLHSSAGAEVALAMLRNTLIIVGAGKGAEGAQVLFGTSWSY
ncbi:MAG: BamA/TamA family outer membrane protein [Gemmatimonadales bacterium]|nr:BamA/TamA family outer membrane protein [Gemmatimonadales bacterium]